MSSAEDFAAGKGGSYRVNEDGEIELVERTQNPDEPAVVPDE
jgi:hypothetical protein